MYTSDFGTKKWHRITGPPEVYTVLKLPYFCKVIFDTDRYNDFIMSSTVEEIGDKRRGRKTQDVDKQNKNEKFYVWSEKILT